MSQFRRLVSRKLFSSRIVLRCHQKNNIFRCYPLLSISSHSFSAKAELKAFESKIVSLLESENEEIEWTEDKLPDMILNELTHHFEKPKLARITNSELYKLLQSHTSDLMPFNNLLQHWTVNELKSTKKDDNFVKMPTNDADDQKQQTQNEDDQISDDKILDLMNNEYLDHFKKSKEEIDKLYETAMLFYDLSSNAIDVNNRLSSIFLTLCTLCGHLDAQLQLGKMYLLGYGVEMNYESAIYHFVLSAGCGSIEARTYLGIMYMNGFGLKRNIYKAYLLLSESSKFMNPIGQRYLAQLYENGYYEANEYEFVIEKDHFIALRLAEKACNYGTIKIDSNRKLYDAQFIAEAATICGRMQCVHCNDFVAAIKYFEIAASQFEDVDALCNLGHIHWVGVKGQIEANIYKAVSYLLSAANKGHKRAHRELGMIYVYSFENSEIQNCEEGINWLDLAAKEGFIDCYFRLGEIYASGNNKYKSVKQDLKVAKKYFEYARDESNVSKNYRDKLPENVWNLILNNPLQAIGLIENYEKLIGAKWIGQYLHDLDPSAHSKIN